MKRKIIFLLSLVLIICLSLCFFTACDDGETPPTTNGGTSSGDVDNNGDGSDGDGQDITHTVSGNLQLGANIVKQEGESIRAGRLQEWEDRTRVNLQEYSAPIFNFSNATPGTWQRATIEVTNLSTGRDAIGFTYKVRIIELKGSGDDGELSASDVAMASQIKVTVVRADGTSHEFNLIDCSKPENDVELGSIDVGGELEFFSIKIEVPTDCVLTNEELTFDLQIVATQHN